MLHRAGKAHHAVLELAVQRWKEATVHGIHSVAGIPNQHTLALMLAVGVHSLGLGIGLGLTTGNAGKTGGGGEGKTTGLGLGTGAGGLGLGTCRGKHGRPPQQLRVLDVFQRCTSHCSLHRFAPPNTSEAATGVHSLILSKSVWHR